MIRVSLLLIPAWLALVSGCGGGTATVGEVPCSPAKGSLFIGEKPAAGATLICIPKTEASGSLTPRPRATVGEDGSFALSTFGTGDGAPVGEYGLMIFWPGNDSDDRLNGRYDSPAKTKQTVTIAAGNNDLPPIKLK